MRGTGKMTSSQPSEWAADVSTWAWPQSDRSSGRGLGKAKNKNGAACRRSRRESLVAHGSKSKAARGEKAKPVPRLHMFLIKNECREAIGIGKKGFLRAVRERGGFLLDDHLAQSSVNHPGTRGPPIDFRTSTRMSTPKHTQAHQARQHRQQRRNANGQASQVHWSTSPLGGMARCEHGRGV